MNSSGPLPLMGREHRARATCSRPCAGGTVRKALGVRQLVQGMPLVRVYPPLPPSPALPAKGREPEDWMFPSRLGREAQPEHIEVAAEH